MDGRLCCGRTVVLWTDGCVGRYKEELSGLYVWNCLDCMFGIVWIVSLDCLFGIVWIVCLNDVRMIEKEGSKWGLTMEYIYMNHLF